mgnify:CR=1 FL=1
MASKNKHGGKRKGSGRKALYNEPTERQWVIFPLSIYKQVKQYATDNNISFAVAVVQIIKNYFNQLKG